MLKMYFNFKDVFRAARLGFSPKKIWAFFCGLLLGLAIYNLFSYLAHAAAGRSFSDTWVMFGLLPLPWSDFGLAAWIFWFLGAAGLGVIYMLTSAVVARIATEQLSGNEFYETKEAIAFIKQGWKAVLGAPLVIASFIAFLVLGGLVLGLWGRIPYLGELTVSAMAIPIYLVCLFIVFLLAALMVALFYSPIVAGAAKSDTFDNLFEIFSTITSQPWRLVVYNGLLKLVVLLGFGVFALFTHHAVMISYKLLGVFMGQRFLDLGAAAFNLYTPPMVLNVMLGAMQGWGFDQGLYLLNTPVLNWSGHVSAFLMGMSLNLVRLLVISYAAAATVVGQTIIYGIIVMKRDDRNIFERQVEKGTGECPPVTEENEDKVVNMVKIAKAVKKPVKTKK
ncbi:hypothetical protein HZA73_02000 [candidate division TA06 bacterium]|nr:hypothetical protein [candidate division TA06 bacterium]